MTNTSNIAVLLEQENVPVADILTPTTEQKVTYLIEAYNDGLINEVVIAGENKTRIRHKLEKYIPAAHITTVGGTNMLERMLQIKQLVDTSHNSKSRLNFIISMHEYSLHKYVSEKVFTSPVELDYSPTYSPYRGALYLMEIEEQAKRMSVLMHKLDKIDDLSLEAFSLKQSGITLWEEGA